MRDFPLYEAARLQPEFGSHPYAAALSEDDPILLALEFFLSLTNVAGFDGKLANFLCKHPSSKNEAVVQWGNVCAELGAIYLLGKELGLPIVGFDVPSPRRRRSGSNCDIAVDLAGKNTFFEVKKSSKEETQILPDDLQEALDSYECQYNLTGQLLDRGYDCSRLPNLLAAIGKHLACFRELREHELVVDHLPQSLCFDGVVVHFFPREPEWPGGYILDPATHADLRSYLLESGHPGKEGPMRPQVEVAIERGTDYLMVQVPTWKGLEHLAADCFKDLRKSSGHTYSTSDERLGDLKGVVLLAVTIMTCSY